MRASDPSRRGSVLIIVMVTMLFTAAALVAFLDKASNDLLVEARVAVANRLRVDAYSALEVTLAVLQDFSQAGGGLHSPSEGWNDPLAWAGWSPSDGNKVEVTFQDESGKLPLAHATTSNLVNLFQIAWQMNPADAQHLADVLLAWMQQSYVPTTGIEPDYEQSSPAYEAPLRPLRSYGELAAIDYAREVFYDEAGRPNELWWKFQQDISLYNFEHPNINGANADVLTSLGQFTPGQQQSISNFLNGAGDYTVNTGTGKQWFDNSSSVTGVVGASGSPQEFGYTISALRVLVTVHQGGTQFQLAAVIAPQGGATTVQTTATDARKNGANGAGGETAAKNGLNGASTNQSNSTATAAQTAAAASKTSNLQYPFTVLEILENDQILNPPPPPPRPPT